VKLETTSAGRRGASGLEFGGGTGWRLGLDFSYGRFDGLEGKNRESRLRISPSSDGDGAATIMVAATGVADCKRFGF